MIWSPVTWVVLCLVRRRVRLLSEEALTPNPTKVMFSAVMTTQFLQDGTRTRLEDIRIGKHGMHLQRLCLC